MNTSNLSTKDLMVGDWVQGNPCGQHCDRNNKTYYKIAVLDIGNHCWGYSVCGAIVELKYDNIFPIPLTPEILEKNGFVPKFSDGCLTEYLIYKDIVDGIHEMYIRIAYFNTEEKEHKLECFDCRTGGCQIWIKYVHQLQHALRICGINKTIKL